MVPSPTHCIILLTYSNIFAVLGLENIIVFMVKLVELLDSIVVVQSACALELSESSFWSEGQMRFELLLHLATLTSGSLGRISRSPTKNTNDAFI